MVSPKLHFLAGSNSTINHIPSCMCKIDRLVSKSCNCNQKLFHYINCYCFAAHSCRSCCRKISTGIIHLYCTLYQACFETWAASMQQGSLVASQLRCGRSCTHTSLIAPIHVPCARQKHRSWENTPKPHIGHVAVHISDTSCHPLYKQGQEDINSPAPEKRQPALHFSPGSQVPPDTLHRPRHRIV